MSVLEGILRLQCRERSEEMKKREQSISGHRWDEGGWMKMAGPWLKGWRKLDALDGNP